jgi:hypothetical protein
MVLAHYTQLRQFRAAHRVAIALARGTAALVDRPDDQALAGAAFSTFLLAALGLRPGE